MTHKVGMISLGCAKNLVDSEVMLGLLQKAGFIITDRESEADILIVNTCAFILPAVEESIQNILELASLKEYGCCKKLLVAGCLPRRYGKQILIELPEVDGLIGTGAVPHVVELVKRALAGEKICEINNPSYQYTPELPRLKSTPFYMAYVKIAEGCTNCCSFCTIPAIRGRYRSRPLESIEKEVNLLVKRGAREIILIAQDTASYGLDLYGEHHLTALIKRLDSVPNIVWLRLLYCSPDHLTGEIIDALAKAKRFCRYLDIPVQHAHDEILKKMKRRKKVKEILQLIANLRAAIPDIVLRTTFMVGFPGEKEEHFRELLNFMNEVRFERAGVFKFYPEEGTLASKLPEQVPEKIKEERCHRAMTLQQQISLRYNQTRVGQVTKVLIEGKEGNRYYGRTEVDAPEIDGRVYFTSKKRNLSPGEFRQVLIKEACEYDLTGELL